VSGLGGAREQVARLLTLVPYLHARGQVRVEDAATALGVPADQVVKDLKVLFMCGLPGGYPDDLIDVDLDSLEGPEADGVIRVSNADYLARPLRLTATEATAVMVALMALRNGAHEETREIVDRVLAKLQQATSGAVPIDPGVEPREGYLARLHSDLERAVRDGRQVRLTYWGPARDEETERVVDPRGVVTSGGASYLAAWCHSAEDDRMFRLDRIHAATVLDQPVSHSADAPDLNEVLFGFDEQGERVTLRLAPEAGWVVEYYQVDEVRRQPDGALEVDLMVADRRWLERLVLRLAPHAEVLRPEAWADKVRTTAQEALSLYTPPGVGWTESDV
jgi:proteasome accessory factor C